MSNCLKEESKMVNKSNNLSKSYLSKNLRFLKLITNYTQKIKYNNEKINLRFRNSYKYDFNNIKNRTYRSSKNEIKKQNKNYSSFYLKTTNYFDSDLLDSHLIPKDKNKTKKLYTRIFSADTNYTDIRLKSSTTKDTKSRNNSSKTTENLTEKILYSNDSDINFNKDKYNKLLKKKKKENLLQFLENIKIVRKQKIFNSFLDEKYKHEKEMIEEEFYKVQITNDWNVKNLFLLKKFGLAYEKYLDNLHSIKMEERRIDEEYELNKMILESEINKIINKVNKIKSMLLKLINIKEFILFIKNSNFETSDKSKSFRNLEERIKITYNKILSKYNKNKISKSMIMNLKKQNSINRTFIKRKTQKYYSHVNNNQKRNKSFIRKNTESNINTNINKGNKKNSLIIEDKINISDIESVNDFIENFNKFENHLLKDLEYWVEKKSEVINLKENLDNFKLVANEKDKILLKTEILNQEKNKRKILENKLNLIKKNYSEKKNINKNLHKKLYIILTNINQNSSIDKKIELKNVFHNLNKDKRDYEKIIHIPKTLYILKTLESIYLFYYEFIKRFRENIGNEKIYNDILNLYKKEKEESSYKIAKNKIENTKIERKKAIIKKSNKIYITSHMKYNIKLQMKTKKNRIKMKSKEQKEDSFEQLISYY